MHAISQSRIERKKRIRAFRAPSSTKATVLCTLDLAAFVGTLAGVVLADALWVKGLCSLLMSVVIARLFVIGHDACHQAFFEDRETNRWVGRLVFLPSLTNYSLWESGHNLGHHVYTNLRGYDYVWTPRTKAEYDAMSPLRQALERIYRSPLGHGAYYGIELWAKTLLIPTAQQRAKTGGRFTQDMALVLGFAALWSGGLALAALASGQSALLLVLLGFALPFALWNAIMGSVIYLHHTHPDVAWFDDIDLWEGERDGAAGTVLVTFPYRLGGLLNHIMQHPAHHLDVRVPLYNLEAAQATLNAEASRTIEQPLTLTHILDCTRRCKLYDYEARRWMDFEGAYTSGGAVDVQADAQPFRAAANAS